VRHQFKRCRVRNGDRAVFNLVNVSAVGKFSHSFRRFQFKHVGSISKNAAKAHWESAMRFVLAAVST
jgi:hypothetical protein